MAGRVTADAATDLYILGRDLTDSDVDLRAYFHRGGSGFADVAGRLRVPDDGGHQIGGGPITAIGDFDKDGDGDLAIGRGYERPDGERGYVTVQYGGATRRASRSVHAEHGGCTRLLGERGLLRCRGRRSCGFRRGGATVEPSRPYRRTGMGVPGRLACLGRRPEGDMTAQGDGRMRVRTDMDAIHDDR
ncbi:hypothetical protein GCM10010503_44280 [Streptomyces lucensis JCM 4490]|uniref:Integrin-like protein n=1 Tax=Streptomyces lucensis JCM 4490 TaxID=1306176 RepID=A0A918J957_9ACTN|nr:hypothetical protein [Streptomyces lucensis]GGW62176.1 hypothetical protein GCM10010503_44280 [Streptomyces lucensis JCM 4490]